MDDYNGHLVQLEVYEEVLTKLDELRAFYGHLAEMGPYDGPRYWLALLDLFVPLINGIRQRIKDEADYKNANEENDQERCLRLSEKLYDVGAHLFKNDVEDDEHDVDDEGAMEEGSDVEDEGQNGFEEHNGGNCPGEKA